MAVYAVGDVQGCSTALKKLVEAIAFDPRVDELWMAGDLVNRGPDSADVLRWARDHDEVVHAVLGNHDLYLIARSLEVISPRPRDTLDALLAAPDGDQLITWLRHRPLIHRQGAWVMVHAALHPDWSMTTAEANARELETLLRGPEASSLLAESYQAPPARWDPAAPPRSRQLAALAIMTRLRCLAPDRLLTFDYTGTLADCPPDRIPWWRVPHVRGDAWTLITGHWAALGYHREPGLLAIDTGCVWGRHLTAVRLHDGAVIQVAADGSVSRSSH